MLPKDLDLNDVRILVKVADLGGFGKAARFFGLPVSSISRKVSRLEDRLDARLLERSTRSLRPTAVGEIFLQHARRGLADLVQGAAVLEGAVNEPSGRLRISVPILLGQVLLGEVVVSFMAEHPKVRCLMDLNNRRVDLVHEDFDIALRAGALDDVSLIARKLGTIPMGLYASPSYLAEYGRPACPDDLRDHPILDLNPGWEKTQWVFKGPKGAVSRTSLAPRLSVPNLETVLAGVMAGLGIGKLPARYATRLCAEGELEPVLPDWRLPAPEVHALYPHHRSATPALNAFLDFTAKWLSQGTTLLE